MYEFNKTTEAITWLQQGKLLAYPTESVWGIGCDAMNEQAVQQILAIKKRPIEKGMIVVVDSLERIQAFLDILPAAIQQVVVASVDVADSKEQATTWVLPIPQGIKIPKWITGIHDSVAVRVISHPQIKKLCTDMVSQDNPFGFLVSTSCNPAGLDPAKNVKEAQAYFANDDALAYLLGETLGYQLPSQIKEGLTGKILR